MSNPTDPPLSRRAARQAESSTKDAQPEAFAQPVTRRTRGGTPVSVPSSAPTDVSYRTQVRPRVPHYDAPPSTHTVITSGQPTGQQGHVVDHGGGGHQIDGAARDGASSAGAPLAALGSTDSREVAATSLPPVAPPAAPGEDHVRRRDFRPPAEQSFVAPVAPGASGYDSALEYHTQATPSPDSGPTVPSAASSSNGAPPALAVPFEIGEPSRQLNSLTEQTLSRRELRALRYPSTDDASASPVSFDAPVALDASNISSPVPLRAPEMVSPVPVHVPESSPVAYHAPLAPAPIVAPPQSPDLPPLVSPNDHSGIAHPSPASSASSAPTGSHWSVGIHDDDDPFENTFSREVGSTASLSNTNALVLPEMPSGSIAGPVSGTGEIIITGMIDLPRVVASTGTVPTVHESPDIDDLFDPGDIGSTPPDSAPVSALRAVSSHTSSHIAITPSKGASSNTVTTVLVASTVVMAVVAIGLFVLAAVNGLF